MEEVKKTTASGGPSDPKAAMALVRIQSVVRAFIATKRAKQRVKRFVFRTKVALEIESTEANYLRDLQLAINEFYDPMSKILTEQEMRGIFINLKELIELHQELLEDIKAARDNWDFHKCFAVAFKPVLPKLKKYQVYVDNYANAATLLKEKTTENSELEELLKKQSRKSLRMLHLEDILIMPVQRLPRYQLLLKELAKFTEPGHPDEVHIKEAIEQIQEVLSFLNESRKKVDKLEKVQAMLTSVTDLEQSLVLHRTLIFDGPLVLFGKKEAPQRKLSGAGSKLDVKKDAVLPAKQGGGEQDAAEKKAEEKKKIVAANLWNLIGKEEIYVYLFEDMMLCAKKIKKSTDPRMLFLNKVTAYKYNVMNIVPLFGENCAHAVPDQECSFKVDTDSTHMYICPSPQMRNVWVTKINSRCVGLAKA